MRCFKGCRNNATFRLDTLHQFQLAESGKWVRLANHSCGQHINYFLTRLLDVDNLARVYSDSMGTPEVKVRHLRDGS